MNSSPRIVFCTTCRGRAQHIEQTLPRNLAENPNATIVLLDYNSQDGLANYLRLNHGMDMARGRLVVYSYPWASQFIMAHAKNLAHRLGMREGGDILVTLDADNFTGPRFDEYIYNQFSCGSAVGPERGMFLCPEIVKSGEGKEQRRFLRDSNGELVQQNRGIAGRLVVRSQDFIKAGGYDEAFVTWRGEDTDLNARLTRMGFNARRIESKYLDAVRHGAGLRFKEYPHARQYESDEEPKRIYQCTHTVVNYGAFGCGTVQRNYGPESVTLAPIPTRIFGIGLHKTATTSLHAAFQLLGFDSFHWNRGDMARDIWDQMGGADENIYRGSAMLERYYALCDLPIPLLYRKLDDAYPGSKFILTIRNEDKWLNSVAKLWSYQFNPSRWEWDVYPFSNRIHRALYGRIDFDPPTFLARYRQHNAEVREFFKARPNDLLVMDMDKGAGWPQLCGFLGKPVPAVPYPRAYATKPIGHA